MGCVRPLKALTNNPGKTTQMSLYSEFLTDKALEEKGVQFTYTGGDGKPIFRVRLARSGGGNKKYDQVRERVTAPYRRLRSLTDEMQSQIAREVFAEAVVVDNTWETYVRHEPTDEGSDVSYTWERGLESETGAVVPATIDNICKLVQQLPDLYAVLLSESMNIDNYKKEAREQDSKN